MRYETALALSNDVAIAVMISLRVNLKKNSSLATALQSPMFCGFVPGLVCLAIKQNSIRYGRQDMDAKFKETTC